MKFLQIGGSHPRNEEFMRRACDKFGIDYHHTHSGNPPDAKYDIIWSPGNWVNPDKYPSSKFIFGPQFWVLPDKNHPFFTQSKPEHISRCVYTCLSNWIVDVWNEVIDTSKSNIPFVPLPFGLDIQESTKDAIEYDCIIYFKDRHPSLLDFVKLYVESVPLKYKIFKYGSYNLNDYLETLKKTKFVIWVGCHESQGFAFQECLASGTPILLYDVTSMKDEYTDHFMYTHHREKLLATVASYWDARCGMIVKTNQEFIDTFPNFIKSIDSFRPSDYIRETLSDEVCFKRFLDKLHITL